MELIGTIYKAVLEGDAPATKAAVEAALKTSATADQIMQMVMLPRSLDQFPSQLISSF